MQRSEILQKNSEKMVSRETIASVVILILLVIIANWIYGPMIQNPGIAYSEEPLEKNEKLQILPGEIYVYAYKMNDSEVNATYYVFEGKGCTRIRFMESVNISETCLDEFGMDGPNNASLNNSQIVFFKPWMLALEEGWTWNSKVYINYSGNLHEIASLDYRVVRMDEYANRTAFVVEIKSGNQTEYEWIDSEKRIMLKILGQDYEVNIKSGIN